MVDLLVKDAAHATLFGTLCILDGVRSLGLENSRLELRLVREDGHESILSSSEVEDTCLALHELL